MSSKQVSTFTRRYRSTLFQAIVVGFLSFTQAGIATAIGGLGAGGLQTVHTANTASAVMQALMSVTAPFFGIFSNKFGVKATIAYGCIGGVFYSAGLYQNSKDGTQWFILFGAVMSGLTNGAFWTGEATVAILYPEDEHRGMFIGIWQLMNKFGGIIAGSVTLALNIHNNKAGKVGLNTYIVLIIIQCLGFPASFLLSPPEKVIRKDGKRVKSNVTGKTFKQELAVLWRVAQRKEIIFIAPLCLADVWINTWQSNYVTHHFSVRARSLNSLLTAIINGSTDIIGGYLLDRKNIRRSIRVRASWFFALAVMTGFFIYAIYIQHWLDNNPRKGMDWSGSPDFAKTYIPFQVFRIGGELLYNWIYWYIGAYQFTSEEVPYCSAIIRFFESLGHMFAFVIGTVNKSDMTNLAVSVGVFYVSAITTSYIVFKANDDEIIGRLDERLEDAGSSSDLEDIEVKATSEDLKNEIVVSTEEVSEKSKNLT